MKTLLLIAAILLTPGCLYAEYTQAPDGTYVSGSTVSQAPDGSWHGGGDSSFTQTPDGAWHGEND